MITTQDSNCFSLRKIQLAQITNNIQIYTNTQSIREPIYHFTWFWRKITVNLFIFQLKSVCRRTAHWLWLASVSILENNLALAVHPSHIFAPFFMWYDGNRVNWECFSDSKRIHAKRETIFYLNWKNSEKCWEKLRQKWMWTIFGCFFLFIFFKYLSCVISNSKPIVFSKSFSWCRYC